MRRVHFWGSALGCAAGFALLVAFLFPYEALQVRGSGERWRVWQLTLWTSGCMGILFGLSGLLSGGLPLGVRDVVEAGSLKAAREAREQAHRADGSSGGRGNFAWWLICTGAGLLAIYFLSWGVERYYGF